MSDISTQEWSNTYAIADEAGLRGQVTRCRVAGMSAQEAEGVIVSARDKLKPYQWISKCIGQWRARQ